MYKPKHAVKRKPKNYAVALVIFITLVAIVLITIFVIIPFMTGCKDKPVKGVNHTMTTAYTTYVTEPTEKVLSEANKTFVVRTVKEPVETTTEPFNEDVDLLARLIHAEAGSETCSDDLQKYVGSVALNRVMSKYYPSTLREVVYQDGQYECVMNGHIDKPATEREIRVAKWLYSVGSQLPREVVFQAEFIQGDGIYLKEQNMYFCYVGQINEGDVIYVE